MKIFRTDLPSSGSQFKKSRASTRPFEFVDLIKKSEDELETEETEYYIRRYKKKKDGSRELLYELKKEVSEKNDYAESLRNKLNHLPYKK